MSDKCVADGQVHAQIDALNQTVLAVSLEAIPGPAVAIFQLSPQAPKTALEKLNILVLLSDTPALYLQHLENQKVKSELTDFRSVLDLLLLLNNEQKFQGALMTLVTEVAARFNCSRVSIGWINDGYIKLQAISHMQHFDEKMEIVNTLEAAMEECLDQDEEILLPRPASSLTISRDHETYAHKEQASNLLSLPLRHELTPVSVLTCERDRPFSSDDVRSLRILCDQLTARLQTLKATDKWVGCLLADRARQQLKKIFGVEHTLLKFSAVCVLLLFILSLTISIPYRVEAPFILKSKEVQQVASPIEGYVEQVHIKLGQKVSKDQLLVSLDNQDILLEESAAVANQVKFLREAEKARALGSPIEMKIAQAQADQAQAQLELIRFRLSQAELRSEIDGIVVEGKLEELRGAPVSRGQTLAKVARQEELFIELKIDEKDIHELAVAQTGSVAFVSRPEDKFSVEIERIDPLAQTDETGNVFLARATFDNREAWWRPGMSGIARIDIEKRSIFWILTHRTLEFFQLLVWW